MKYVTIVTFVLKISLLHSQNIVVDYVVRENRNNAITSIETNYILVVKGNESNFFNPQPDKGQFIQNQNASEVKNQNGSYVKFDDNTFGEVRNDFFYKNYLKDSIIFNEKMVNKPVIVKEQISLFKWEILPKSDTIILGYKCQLAKVAFRGRNYKAYFAPALNPFGGPWKFDGLPGLILFVRSIDNYFIIAPTKITRNEKNSVIVNPFNNSKEIITWTAFVSGFEKKLKQILKMMKSQSEPGDNGKIKITDRIEDLGIKEMSFN